MFASWSLSATSNRVSGFFMILDFAFCRGSKNFMNSSVTSPFHLAWARNERIPSPSTLAWDTRETAARRRVGNIDEVIARGALNLPARELHFTFQVLLAMRALEFELVGSH